MAPQPTGDVSGTMGHENQTDIRMRIVIEQPVVGVSYSLQSRDGAPLDPKRSSDGEPLAYDFTIRVAPGPKFLGDQVHREGTERRFVYIHIGQRAGDPDSPWTRRMKIDIHDIGQDLLDRASLGGVIMTTVCGTGKDGSPACATVVPASRKLVEP